MLIVEIMKCVLILIFGVFVLAASLSLLVVGEIISTEEVRGWFKKKGKKDDDGKEG